MGGKKKKGKSKSQATSPAKKSRGGSRESVQAVKRMDGRVAVPGLSNLGNTCFFNAVMQNIGQSHCFRARLGAFLQSPSLDVELKLPNKAESELKLKVDSVPGPFAKELHKFLSLMQEGGGKTLNPRPVFSEISKKASQFAGYKRQDSQELLSCLLDILRNEEIDRIKRAILKSFGVSSAGKTQLTDAQKRDIRGYGMQAQVARTYVDDVFGGILVSTVTCADCENCTVMQETFLDLSLPVFEDKSVTVVVCHSDDLARTKSSSSSHGGVKTQKGGEAQYTQKVSKHQQKKMQREARKATKKANKTKAKTFQEFIRENSEKDALSTDVSSSSSPQDMPDKSSNGTANVVAEEKADTVAAEEETAVVMAAEEEEAVTMAADSVAEETADSMAADTMANTVHEPRASEGRDPSAADAIPVSANVAENTKAATGETVDACSEKTETSADTMAAGVPAPPSRAGDLASTMDRWPDLATETPPLQRRNSAPQQMTGSPYDSLLINSQSCTPPQTGSQTTLSDSIGHEELSKVSMILNVRPEDSTVACCNYASSGPQNDFEMSPKPSSPPPSNTRIPRSVSLDNMTVAMKELQIELKEIDAQASTENDTLLSSGIPQPGAQLNGERDSILHSLQRFCSKEYLTGDNQFACSECTKKLASKERKEAESGSGGEGGDRSKTEKVGQTDLCQEEEEHGDSEEGEDHPEDGQAEPCHDGEDDEEGGDHSKIEGDSQTVPCQEDGGGERVDCPGTEEDRRAESSREGQDGDVEDTKTGHSEAEGLAEEDEGSGKEAASNNEGAELQESCEQNTEESKASPQHGAKRTEPKIAFCDATKQFLIQKPPTVLILHLKRFSQQGRRLKKNNKQVSFPTQLDLGPFCTANCQASLMYSLYGVVVHSGGMQDGHYTAYIKTRPTSQATPTAGEDTASQETVASQATTKETDSSSRREQWYYTSDTHVRTATEGEALKSQAYLLFYEQCSSN